MAGALSWNLDTTVWTLPPPFTSLQLWQRFSASSVKSDAGIPPALVCAATCLNVPNSC